jgi:hypothetical protein
MNYISLCRLSFKRRFWKVAKRLETTSEEQLGGF